MDNKHYVKSTIDEQEVNKFDHHAQDWWDKQGPLKTLHDINDTRLEFILAQVELKGKTVLDVGCGGGILCEALRKAGAQVTGLDVASDAIAIAREHADHEKLDINYVSMPIEEFEQGSFDVITCMEMLEHVNNPELVLEHCRRLLKPGGILFLSTISRTVKAYMTAIVAAEYVLKLLPRQTHDYGKFIKPSELAAMARAFGFSLLDMKGLHYNPLSRKAALVDDVSVNYVLSLR